MVQTMYQRVAIIHAKFIEIGLITLHDVSTL